MILIDIQCLQSVGYFPHLVLFFIHWKICQAFIYLSNEEWLVDRSYGVEVGRLVHKAVVFKLCFSLFFILSEDFLCFAVLRCIHSSISHLTHESSVFITCLVSPASTL